jgi:hypothetical protein
VTGWEPLIALLGLGLLVHVGMGVRTALALRRVGVPAARAWPAAMLAWPLVRRAVAGRADPAAGDHPGHGPRRPRDTGDPSPGDTGDPRA